MSEYEKHEYDEDEDEYLQNVEHFEDVNTTEKDIDTEDFDFNPEDRVYGGREYDVEETIGERFLGLTEMFPESIRESSVRIVNCMEKFVKKSYNCACNFWWTAFVMAAIIISPIVYEYERTRGPERRRQCRRSRRVHGPNVAMNC